MKDREVPEKVKEAFEKIKQNAASKVKLIKIKGSYFVYAYTYVYDEKTNARRYVQYYLGKIEESGKFVKRLRKMSKYKAESFSEYLRARFGSDIDRVLNKFLYPDDETMAIIQALSMDSRSHTTEIARQTGIPASTVSYKLQKVIETYKIHKTVEIRPDTFGFTRFLVTVRFLTDSKPKQEEVRALLEKEPRVQLVLAMTGYYDLAIYIVAESTEVLENIIYEMRSSSVFAPYSAAWNISYIIEPVGWFVPLRNEFFEQLVKQKVWHRTKETPRKLQGQLTVAEYTVLAEMNKDAGQEFREIELRNKLNEGSASYTYDKLLSNKTIERATIIMRRLPAKYFALLYVVQTDMGKFNKTRKEFLEEIVKDMKFPTNRFVYDTDISAPYGVVLLLPVYIDGDLEKAKEELLQRVKGIKIRSSVITRILIGNLGTRKFDIQQSGPYKALSELTEQETELQKQTNKVTPQF